MLWNFILFYLLFIMVIILLIIIILLLFIIKNKEKFNTNSINNIKKFKEFISNHKGKKKNILICSCGPSLNELKNFKKKIKKEFLDDCYVTTRLCYHVLYMFL